MTKTTAPAAGGDFPRAGALDELDRLKALVGILLLATSASEFGEDAAWPVSVLANEILHGLVMVEEIVEKAERHVGAQPS